MPDRPGKLDRRLTFGSGPDAMVFEIFDTGEDGDSRYWMRHGGEITTADSVKPLVYGAKVRAYENKAIFTNKQET